MVFFAGQKRVVFDLQKVIWGERRDSNPRPLEPQSNALSN